MGNSEFDYRGPIKLIVFDWAGTTVDYGCFAPVRPFVGVFGAAGVEITLAEARVPMGMHKKDHIRALGTQPEIARRWSQRHGCAFTEDDVERLYLQLQSPEVARSITAASTMIPGVVDCVGQLQERGIKIGATTGYFRQAADPVREAAAAAGYRPDCSLCVDDVPAGRPAPWGMFKIMQTLDVYPPAAVVKVGDTLPDVGEGRNAGVWTVGVTRTGNDLGLSEAETLALPPAELRRRVDEVGARLLAAGAHFVIDSVPQILELLPEIEARLARGERP
ncbi:MAG: phosphonoacetaldehyde hydrolase [Pirellulales bacterium]|nr:phosphonoacetaldehyde hydrolase [Pirellulales bacterium]